MLYVMAGNYDGLRRKSTGVLRGGSGVFRRARGAPAPDAKGSRGAGGSYRHAPGEGGGTNTGRRAPEHGKSLAGERLWAV